MSMSMWVLLLIILLLPSPQVAVAEAADEAPIARRGCNDSCGGVSIPFPFGMGEGCFLDEWFEIECNASPNLNGSFSTKPFLSKFGNIEAMELNADANLGLKMTVGIAPLNVCVVETPQQKKASIDLTGSPFSFSGVHNVFMVEGCSGSAVLLEQNKNIMAGCGTVCQTNDTAKPNNSCYGVHCCQTMLSADTYSLPFYHVDAYPQDSSTQNCLVATLIETDSANQYAGKLSSSDPSPVVWYWSWISTLEADNTSHSSCDRYRGGLRCECTGNYYGNAYVSNGCQDSQGKTKSNRIKKHKDTRIVQAVRRTYSAESQRGDSPQACTNDQKFQARLQAKRQERLNLTENQETRNKKQRLRKKTSERDSAPNQAEKLRDEGFLELVVEGTK